MMIDKIPESRDRYRYWLTIPTRWQDGDPYGHVNNAVYYSFMDTVLTTMLLERGVLRNPSWSAIGLCVESHCEFLAPITFPAQVEGGLRIGKIGNSSLRYEVGLFPAGAGSPAAVGYFVHVFVDANTRRPVPLDAATRAKMIELTLD
jgi:acyl-CoA thioester hydrolase